MSLIYQSKLLKKLKIRRRGVVRTIDFLVSFTLFIILLTQFYLIIINMNLNLASTSTQPNNPAQLFSEKLLSYPGTENWGRMQGSPATIGLASDNYHSTVSYFLDLAKLGRLNQEINYFSLGSKYSYLNPTNVVSNITGPTSNAAFRLTTRPPIQVKANLVSVSPTNSIIDVKTLTWDNVGLANVQISAYHVSLSTGLPLPTVTSISDQNGDATITTNINADNYVAIIYAHAGSSWGISWVKVQGGSNTISSTGIASFSLNNPIKTSNSIFEFAKSTFNTTIRATSAYVEASNNSLITNSTVISNNTGLLNQTFANVGTTNPFIQVYSTTSGTTDYYRVVTQPLIYDNYNYTSPLTTSYAKSQYPVYETPNFSTVNLNTIYTYSTLVLTDRGPILFSLELSET